MQEQDEKDEYLLELPWVLCQLFGELFKEFWEANSDGNPSVSEAGFGMVTIHKLLHEFEGIHFFKYLFVDVLSLRYLS